jgi:membrane fusion protein, multidrug efflux system
LRKVLFSFVPMAALTLGAGGGWFWWNGLRFLRSTDDAYLQSDVSVISPKVEGYIKKVRVTDNQEVAEDAVLFVIDDRDFKAKVAQAEAAKAIEEASVASYDAASSCSSR